jgi:hypothetical protein
VAYVRCKRLKGHDYYYLVESYRQAGKVKTRTLASPLHEGYRDSGWLKS